MLFGWLGWMTVKEFNVTDFESPTINYIDETKALVVIGVKCKDQKSYRDCKNSCSPAKGKENLSYACAWVKNKCIDSNKQCAAPSPTTIYCPKASPGTECMNVTNTEYQYYHDKIFECKHPIRDEKFLCCSEAGKFMKIDRRTYPDYYYCW